MKKITFLLVGIIALLAASCDGMLDNIQDYLDEGETIYVGKIDSLYTNSGKSRIQINGRMRYGVTQTSCLIEWKSPNGNLDSLRVAIDRKEAMDIFSVILENMSEGHYDFKLVTFDAEGNRSITTTTEGYVYGEFYEQSLMNRSISEIKPYKNEGFIVQWKTLNDEGAIETEITFETKDGTKTITTPIEESITFLEGCLPDAEISWNTRYLPEEGAIDTFQSFSSTKISPASYVVELDKGKFAELILPTDARMDYWGFSISRIWNGNTNWDANSMCHSSSEEGWPQWFTFDLGVLTQLDTYKYWQRLDDAYLYEKGDNPQKWELYGCANTPDADGSWGCWIKLMDCESIKPSGVYDGAFTEEDKEYAKAGELFRFSKDLPPVRYIRWKTLETFKKSQTVHFQQVTFWGEELGGN